MVFYSSKWGFALYPLSTEHITLGSAYSDTAAVTSCSRRSQYAKSWITTSSSSSYSAPTALGKRLNKLGNITYWTILNVFYFFWSVSYIKLIRFSSDQIIRLRIYSVSGLRFCVVVWLADCWTTWQKESFIVETAKKPCRTWLIMKSVSRSSGTTSNTHAAGRAFPTGLAQCFISAVFFNARRPAIVQFCCVHLSVRRIHSWIVSKPINTVTLYELWIKCKWAVYNKLISANEVLEVSAQRAHIFETS